MCEFISWIEKDDKVYFLTGEQVYDIPRGRELQVHSQGIEDDKCGHGAIRWFYNMEDEDGENRECADFSTPHNFPPEIVEAVKLGKMRRMGISLELLNDKRKREYGARRKIIYDKYEVKCNTLDGEYRAKLKTIFDEYEYTAKLKPLNDDYRAKLKTLEEWFWETFAIPENRNPLWV